MAIIDNCPELRGAAMLQLVMMIANNVNNKITPANLPCHGLRGGGTGREGGRWAGVKERRGGRDKVQGAGGRQGGHTRREE